jgi:hypothetical protein
MMLIPNLRPVLAASALFACLAAGMWGQQGGATIALGYDSQTRGPVPIPPSERTLQTVVAEPWFKVSHEPIVLEGPAFERNGNLLFCDVSGRRVLRLTAEKRLSTVVSLNDVGPGGLAIHNDGRIFMAAMNLIKGTGLIAAVQPDGTEMQTVVPATAGYMPNDVVFDAQGAFTSVTFEAFPRILKGVFTMSHRNSRPLRPCCRISRWQTASPSVRAVGSCGLPSSVEISCTESSWLTRRRLRQSAQQSPTISSARHLIRCVPTATAIPSPFWLSKRRVNRE